MEYALNFRTLKGKTDYFEAYDETLKLWRISYTSIYVDTQFGKTHVLVSGKDGAMPLVLLHASNCSSAIWYPNIEEWGRHYKVYAVDIISEPSKSLLKTRLKDASDCTQWLKEVLEGLQLRRVFLAGLSIGGWICANFAVRCPNMVEKLILMSPVQTLAKMHTFYFFRIMKLGFFPSRKVVEDYIGWGSKAENNLPDSLINQFIIATINMNYKGATFPRPIKKATLKALSMPVMILLGENETAFNVNKAAAAAKETIKNLNIEIMAGASHLISASFPEKVNQRVIDFLK